MRLAERPTVVVALDPVTASRAALAHAMARQNVTKAALARRIGRTEGAVRRLVSGSGGVEIDTVLQALTGPASQAAFAVTTESIRSRRCKLQVDARTNLLRWRVCASVAASVS